MPAEERLLRLRKAMELTGLTRSPLYRLIEDGDFPRPIKLTRRAVVWRYSEVQAWIDKVSGVIPAKPIVEVVKRGRGRPRNAK